IARSAAAGTDGELAGQMRLRTRGERGDLLVADMHPLDLALAPDQVGQPIQAVADNAVDPLDPRCGEGFGELISNGFCHFCRSPFLRRAKQYFFAVYTRRM